MSFFSDPHPHTHRQGFPPFPRGPVRPRFPPPWTPVEEVFPCIPTHLPIQIPLLAFTSARALITVHKDLHRLLTASGSPTENIHKHLLIQVAAEKYLQTYVEYCRVLKFLAGKAGDPQPLKWDHWVLVAKVVWLAEGCSWEAFENLMGVDWVM